ncbi:MAG: 23S rRNA (adenine(1618)-N(6))-methyltransferase RlmF [Flavobacteriales bacterium]|nr:23S rRNA (adenine(1618)-N(6))-methyltransferase RlmF [Flavobacteriales bacterium]
MSDSKKPTKNNLHPRNLHQEQYDFQALIETLPELKSFVRLNDYGNESIDFFDPEAVKFLNKALLKHFYKIDFWELPMNYLCPPIPGRADYIHYVADLVKGKKNVKCLDIGVGANCVYPIIGISSYDWSFVGSDIDPIAIENALQIASNNRILKDKLELRLQLNTSSIFKGILSENERFDLSICNPPFHSSALEAQTGSQRKISNLKNQKNAKVVLNFGGQNNELWCDGGEERFVKSMIIESKLFSNSCLWFTSLISKKDNLPKLYKTLKSVGVFEVKTIQMSQGNKISHLLAWTFQNEKQQKDWKLTQI